MKLLAILLFLTWLSCTNESPKADVVSTAIDIFVEDNLGQNLLSDNAKNKIDVDKIRLFYKKGDDLSLAFDSKLDCPYHVCEMHDGEKHFLRIFPNSIDSETYPMTYIQWDENNMDTIKCHFIRNNQSIVCDKVWWNESLLFPDKAIPDFERAIKVIK